MLCCGKQLARPDLVCDKLSDFTKLVNMLKIFLIGQFWVRGAAPEACSTPWCFMAMLTYLHAILINSRASDSDCKKKVTSNFWPERASFT